jgi:hypothetical protein
LWLKTHTREGNAWVQRYFDKAFKKHGRVDSGVVSKVYKHAQSRFPGWLKPSAPYSTEDIARFETRRRKQKHVKLDAEKETDTEARSHKVASSSDAENPFADPPPTHSLSPNETDAQPDQTPHLPGWQQILDARACDLIRAQEKWSRGMK